MIALQQWVYSLNLIVTKLSILRFTKQKTKSIILRDLFNFLQNVRLAKSELIWGLACTNSDNGSMLNKGRDVTGSKKSSQMIKL